MWMTKRRRRCRWAKRPGNSRACKRGLLPSAGVIQRHPPRRRRQYRCGRRERQFPPGVADVTNGGECDTETQRHGDTESTESTESTETSHGGRVLVHFSVLSVSPCRISSFRRRSIYA